MKQLIENRMKQITKRLDIPEPLTEPFLALAQELFSLGCASHEKKLAALLLSYPPGLTIALSQQQVADEIGASRSYVSTLLNEWERGELILNGRRKIHVKDRAALERCARDGE